MNVERIHPLFMTFMILFLLSGGQVFSQPLKVVTKSLKESFVYEQGMEVNIEGERAEIIMESWDKKEIEVLIDLVAKHPSERIARADVAKMEYSMKRHGNKIYFRNYISQKGDEDPVSSQLKAIYTVKLPKDCPSYIKNQFGSTFVQNMSSTMTLNSNYTNTVIKNYKGNLELSSKYGDIEGDHIDGVVNISGRRTDITLSQISGVFDIYSSYGLIKLFTDPNKLQSLNIDGEQSDVYFFDEQPGLYGYTLTAHYGSITTPTDLPFNYIENNQTIKRAVFKPSREMASVSINISFGNIIIRNP